MAHREQDLHVTPSIEHDFDLDDSVNGKSTANNTENKGEDTEDTEDGTPNSPLRPRGERSGTPNGN